MSSSPPTPLNVLITGCAGFIGSKVSELLLGEGHRVMGVDNMNSAYDPQLKDWRLARLQEMPNFQSINMDITDRKSVQDLFEGSEVNSTHPFDAVINLAARAGVRQSMEDPWVFYETNVIGTLNLLEMCRTQGVQKFVLASSSSVYGRTDEQATPSDGHDAVQVKQFPEDLPTDRPISPYAASKKAAEGLCYSYHDLYGIDTTVFRFFTVYGPAGRPDMSIFRFIHWIAEGEPVVVYGDGTQERDFTYVEDVARGIFAGLKPLGFETINLGSDRPVSLHRVISLVEQILDKPAHIDYQPAHPADIKATWADISKAERLLNWAPETMIEKGLEEAVRWYQDNRQWARTVQL